MLYKQAAGSEPAFYAPSIKDLGYAHTNSKNVANLILAALGLSTAGAGAKWLVRELSNSRLSSSIQPSSRLQKKLRNAVAPIDNEFLYSDRKMQHPYDSEYEEEIKRIEKELKKIDKESSKEASANSEFIKQAWDPFGIGEALTTDRKGDTISNPLKYYLADRNESKFKGDLKTIDVAKALNYPDKGVSELLHYDPHSLKSDSKWVKNISGPLAKLGPQSAIPLAVALGGGVMLAPVAAKALVKAVRNVLPKPKRKSEFVDAAKAIYEDAARELQEVGYRKEKDKNKEKYGSYKEAEKKIADPVDIGAHAGNPLISASNIPTLLLAAALSYTVAKGAKGFDRGIDRARKDLSHQTQLLRGWAATNKLRDYNYNPMTAELAEEPGIKTRTMREKNKKIKALLEDIKDTRGMETDNALIRKLTDDYLEA